jgi:hypothetical protein
MNCPQKNTYAEAANIENEPDQKTAAAYRGPLCSVGLDTILVELRRSGYHYHGWAIQ